ncbi:Histone-lysine N-methyltransferase ATXR2 [Capsicum annuum]|nr:Histone-lysine N-methyltransferase ATXR2 [Capsicum annuum]KAF3664494.1 Histone-lysine N-methyltransferase ATXR2 [Capsicum annuum]
MEIICPIDAQFSDLIATLLKPPPPHEKYFEELLVTRQCDSLKVKPVARYGKGVYAETDFKEEDLVLKDQMLAGAQHTSNKVDCLVCSYCFCFIGSIELQIGRKLYLEQLGVSSNNECHMEKDCDNSDSSVGEDDSDVEDQQVSGECSSSPSKDKISLPKDVVESLFHGEMKLPYSEKFSLPPIVSCPGGCKENYYCSKSCAEADWESFHSLLCTGEGSKSLSTNALQKFIEHANDTNDIFLLAAKVISFTILRHKKLKEGRHEGKGKQVISESIDFSLLGQAWKPVSMGYKRRWWDCIALPDDVDGSDEASFRMQIKELALTLWAVRMETYLEALDLWEAVEEDYDVLPLSHNPTVAKIKSQKGKKIRKSKAKATLFAIVSPTILTRIMTLKSAKEIWDYLKEEYTGDERIRDMKMLNLIREFELQKMKESEAVKEYSGRLLGIINKVRLLGTKFKDSRIIEKILVAVPERYEALITTLENTKDLSKIILAELLNTLQAQEQKRLMRQDGMVEGALTTNHKTQSKESPVEDYFLYIDDLPLSEKGEAEQTTKAILDALGDDYSICCQGTAFFPLQSCMNHSCRPNAKAFKREEDRDGQATIIALQPIAKGEEITISYIDEDLPFEERQALLADYGFRLVGSQTDVESCSRVEVEVGLVKSLSSEVSKSNFKSRLDPGSYICSGLTLESDVSG